MALAFVYKCVFILSVTRVVLLPQAQAHTPPPKSTFRSRRPRPTSRGNPVMTAAFSRHSQSGTAMCESSQHALLSASFPNCWPELCCCCEAVASGGNGWDGAKPFPLGVRWPTGPSNIESDTLIILMSVQLKC